MAVYLFHVTFKSVSAWWLPVAGLSTLDWMTYYFILTILIFRVHESNFADVTGLHWKVMYTFDLYHLVM